MPRGIWCAHTMSAMGQYSDTLMDHFTSPRNIGRMESPDRVGIAGTPGQGPFMVLCLKLQNDIVEDAKYQTHGCGVTVAAGSALTELIISGSLDQCRSITVEHLTASLGASRLIKCTALCWQSPAATRTMT